MRKSVIIGTILASLILLITVPAHMETGSLAGQKICLDPGHGGSATGAINEDYGLEEKDINIDVAYGLKALLGADGATVVMTRTDDSDKSNNNRYTFCNNEQATILVSVHTNSTSDPTMDGSLALYFHKDDKVLAQAIYDGMYPYLRDTALDPDNFTDFGLDRFASGVLLKSDMPAAMMEPLFMSHPGEADWLTVTMHLVDGKGVVVLDDAGNPTPNSDCVDCRRAQIAQAIYDGISAYFGPAEPTPTPEPGGVMHVASIDMSLEQRGPWTNAVAAILIVDTDDNPVAGATVTGHWTGSATDTDTVTTDENGVATVRSNRRRDTPGEFTFTVDAVSKDGWNYDPDANIETSDSISF
jgi:hypothetical protein